jgi:Outer membrane receptor proteins, mostly Fe transport
MSLIYRSGIAMLCVFLFTVTGFGQQPVKGKIIDAVTKEPIAGASIRCSCASCHCGCATNAAGEFELIPRGDCCTSFAVSSIGYQTTTIQAGQSFTLIQLQHDNTALQEVVVTANREGVKRSLAPVAIHNITSKMIQDAKPITVDQVLNKVSGVYMANLGNEQHSMSIRQPMTTKSLFLYLEDGIPIRTTGLFNHNALLEMNMAAVKNIEVIKGPSSSLYGSEAIGGVVNFITTAPTAVPLTKLSLQGNTIGYKRADVQASITNGKWGFALSGYYADKRNSFIEYTDFHKINFTARVDYRFSEKTSISNSLTWLNYYSDMAGGIDSARFAHHSFGSLHTFTYRKAKALRYRSTFTHSWNEAGKTTASLVYRNNHVGQNPAYSIKDDYRRLANRSWTGNKALAHGEVNEAGFNSYALILQHRQYLRWKKAVFIGGMSADISPSDYSAEYIRVQRDSLSKIYTAYQTTDSLLTHYKNGINNYATFGNFEFSPFEKMRVVASLRYDLFRYHFNNHLQPSAYSGSPDTINHFKSFSPKIGFTYNFTAQTGVYANYSQGFVPPQVTEMYKGVQVPDLQPSVFYNYEAGGWAGFLHGKLHVDVSVYQLEGAHEIISVRMNDGSSLNMNAGKTLHQGIELGINARPFTPLSIRFNSAYSKHQFTEFVEKGTTYNGHEMNGAPRWMHNAEAWWRPTFVKGLRLGLEWQKLGSYFMDPLNTVKYAGHDVFHIRAGYQWKAMELWMHIMNVVDTYYAYTSSKSNYGYSYTPGEPRHMSMGISYDLGGLFHHLRRGR